MERKLDGSKYKELDRENFRKITYLTFYINIYYIHIYSSIGDEIC